MKAATLEDALDTFSPAPLQFGPGADGPAFYVARPDEPLADLRTRLLVSKMPLRALLAGHRGCGKSTELNRLAADPQVQQRFAVVQFSVKDSLDLHDCGYVDLLLACVAQCFATLGGPDGVGLGLSAATVEALQRWPKTITEHTREEAHGGDLELEAGAGVPGLSLLFARFRSRLRSEATTRKVIRAAFEPRLSEFLDGVDRFFTDVEQALRAQGKRVLLVVEDLDKLPDLDKALRLFRDGGSYLARPPVSIIYTVPIALHYSKEFQSIRAWFQQTFVLPGVRLWHRGDRGKLDAEGDAIVRHFVQQRVEEGLFDDEALTALVTASGGIFMYVQRIAEGAVLQALTRKLTRVGRPQVDQVTADLRAELERALVADDFALLDQVERHGEAGADDGTPALLHSLHLLDFRNAPRRCAPHPLLLPTLERWRARTRPAA